MLRKLEFEKLAKLGLVIYQPRATMVVPEHIRINARCLVLQYAEQAPVGLGPVFISPQQQKIFLGMLSVLELAANQIMCATIVGHPDSSIIHANLCQWQPKFILQLSMEMPAINWQNCVRTFSPAYLLQNPQYKPQAYKTLLGLRATLNDTSQYNS